MDPSPPDPASPSTPQPQPNPLPFWKEELLRTLHDMVAALPDEAPPESTATGDDGSSSERPLPTLEEFHQALIALEANTRKNVQKTNASLETVAKSLHALRRQMSQIEASRQPAPSAVPTAWLSLDAQLRRLLDRLADPPPPAPLGLSRKWQTAWLEVANGAQIIQNSLAKVLDEQGVRSHFPSLGAPFDPACMEAVKVSPGSGAVASATATDQAEVLEVIEPAYYQGEQLIRAARVHVQR